MESRTWASSLGTGGLPRILSKVKKAHLAIAGLVLAPVCYWLWRIDVIPGIWDIQHWGVDVEAEARTERRLHRESRLAVFGAQEQAIVERLAADPDAGPVVLLGSSTMERFDAAAAFPGAWILNRGIGDEPAYQLVERLEASLPPAAWPRAAGFVLYVASVDYRRMHAGPRAVVLRTEDVLDRLDELAPGVPRLLVGLLPDRRLGEERRAVLEAINADLASLAADRSDVTLLPTDRAPLRDAEGELSAEHSSDPLHLNGLGYQVLASWIRLEGGPISTVLAP